MPSFGKISKEKLATCHPDLQRLMNEAIKYVDFSVTCGYRGQAEQDAAFAAGNSKLKYPQGKHNKTPSEAVDVAPYPLNWNDAEAFTLLSGFILGVACMMGIKIRLGADWDGDFNTLEHKFKDRPHIELI
ncbi:MAG: M15 family metallopeptidase [Chlorobium sp.]|nr:M15 family metallopeptidase [Chlorobium sp.]